MEGIIKFLRSVGRLKGLPRTGWLEVGVKDPESVAEHSYRTAVLAMMLADLQGLDAEKSTRMALLHDLAEAETGDMTPEQKRRRGPASTREEDEAMTHILSTLPASLAERYRSLWEEYRTRASPEAETAVQADKVEMILQALEYEETGVDPSRLDRFWHGEVGGGLPSELVGSMMRKRRGRDATPQDGS